MSVSHFSRKSLRTIGQDSEISVRKDQIDVAEIMEQYHLEAFRNSKRLDSVLYSYIKGIDVLDLLGTVKDVRHELLKIRLESCIFHDFFMKHDNKVITLLASQQKKDSNESKLNAMQRLQSTERQSVASLRKSARRFDYALNYMHKREMTERLYREKDIALKHQEIVWKQELCHLRARIEEQQLRRAEVIETEKNFLLHFENINFTEDQLENKLPYFTRSYVNICTDWLSSIRLKLATLSDDCRNIIDHIRIKRDKRMSLTTADLEILEQRLDGMVKEYESKVDSALLFKHNVLIKTTEMNKESKALSNDNEELKHIREQIAFIERSTKHMKHELKFLSRSDDKHRMEMYEKKQQSLKYKAPSTDDYLTIKEKGSNLIREVETLRRKIEILNISLPKSEQIVLKKDKQKHMFF